MNLEEAFSFHDREKLPYCYTLFQPYSSQFFEFLEEAKSKEHWSADDREFLGNSDLGTFDYFEEQFVLRAAGALTLNTDVLPGAKQIDEIQDVIKEKEIKCIFSEPQFNPKIISTIADDTNIKTGVFDPLGANIKSGKDLYFKLIRNLGNELKGC